MKHDEIKVKKRNGFGRFVKKAVAVVTTAAVFGGVAGGVFNLVSKVIVYYAIIRDIIIYYFK